MPFKTEEVHFNFLPFILFKLVFIRSETSLKFFFPIRILIEKRNQNVTKPKTERQTEAI